jgi:5S rRNA maturation endonuclease (ribonuclease M5)
VSLPVDLTDEPDTWPELPPVPGFDLVARYEYRDEAGSLLYVVARYERTVADEREKTFRQWRLDEDHWVPLGDARRVLYRLPRILEHIAENRRDPIYVVEGEKDVEAVETAGAVATCNPMGAGKWTDAYADTLQGARRVIVVADRDTPGRAHARAVAASLAGVGVAAELLEPAHGKDVSDHLAANNTLDELIPIGDDAAPDGEPQPPFQITVYSAHDLSNLELPTAAEPIVGPFLRRGMATLIGGLTGNGKTTWIYQALNAAVDGGDFLGEPAAGGARVLAVDLEQHAQTLKRNLRESGLDQSDAVDVAPIPEGLALDKRSDQLDALEEVLAAKPYDVVAIDPFYKLHEADSSDELQARLLVALLRRWINQYGFALLTATHCRKLPAGRNTITLDDLFGSSLFTRDPEIVLGIQRWNDLSKLHVFKSREPGLEHGQTFELLFTRGRGYWLKPTIDTQEREAELERVGETARKWITQHPGQSTNKVKSAVGIALKVGRDKVVEALECQVKSGLIPEPLRSGRRAKLWYPLNHAALTRPEPLPGQVELTDENGQAEYDLTGADDFSVGESAPSGQVNEADLDHLEDLREEMGL